MAEYKGLRIVKAAVQHKGQTYTGLRHGIIMQQLWAVAEKAGIDPPKIAFDDQGFVDQYGKFWNRFQSGAIAYRAGQTKTRKQSLLSEDLW